jgi:glycosyltransferase involved in cell wall biosynthesis
MRLLIEGWRFVLHSFALVNQFQLLELVRRPGLEVFHRDRPYLSSGWPQVKELFDPAQEAVLRGISPPGPPPDVTLRMFVPYDFRPAPVGRTYVWGTTEWGLVQNELLARMGIESLAEVLAGSQVMVITTSHWSREGFIRSGAPPEQVAVAPIGVDPAIYHPLPDEERVALRRKKRVGEGMFIFLNVGLMTFNKGVHVLLKAFAAVADRHPGAWLLLKGGEPMYPSRQFLCELARETLTAAETARVESRLIYVDRPLSCLGMAGLYQVADAYVSPYLAEGFNQPVLEAAACGLPVICTRGGPTDDFTEPGFALPIESRLGAVTMNGETRHLRLPDLDHLVALMETVLERPSLAGEARVAGPRMVGERFTWTHAVDRLLEIVAPREPTVAGCGAPDGFGATGAKERGRNPIIPFW